MKKKSQKKTQKQMILEHLKAGHHITDLDALKLFKCRRLAARKWDLVQDGWPIKTTTKEVGDGVYVAEYYMVTTPEQTRLQF